MSVVSKVVFTLRNEGVSSLVNRSARYLAYSARRAIMSSAETEREWQALKGAYSGRVFLLGNGPSLNHTPLYLLAGERTMCFNRFDLMLERLNWTPTFYTVIDDRVLLDTLDVVNSMSAISEHAFFPDVHPYNVDFRDRIIKRPNVHWLHLGGTTFSDRLPWCGINKTVANVGLQVLAYLGFSEVYMLGMDMTYTVPVSAVIKNARDVTASEDDDESHFDPRYFGKGKSFHVPMLHETFLKFEEARRFFDSRGVIVRNATVGGALEEFPRVDLEQVLNVSIETQRMRFRETVEQKVRGRMDILGLLDAAPEPSRPSEVDSKWDVFRVSVEVVNKYIHSCVFEFVPFGPMAGRYLFVHRRLLLNGDVR